MMLTRTSVFIIFFVFSYSAAQYDEDYWNRWGKNLEDSINRQINENITPLKNVGPFINQRLKQNLDSLQDLGPSIQQQVYDGLKPVRDMQARLRIKNGQDGTTIATFKDRKKIIQNGVLYDCDGTISDETGTCSGKLNRAPFDKKEDFCYASITSVINNWYCISNGGSISSGAINGHVYCTSVDKSPTLLISSDEYKRMCGDKSNPVHYKYFTNTPIGEHGPEVECSGTQPSIVCTMTDSNNGINVSNHVYFN